MADKSGKIVFSLRLEKGMYATAVKRAQELGISANDFIRMTLARALEIDEAPYLRLSRIGDETTSRE